MIIRDAEAKDAAKLDWLLTQLIRDEAQYDSNLEPTCVAADNYGSKIGLNGHKLLLIEEDDGQIVGFLYGFLCHVPGIWRSPVAFLDALFIEVQHRRKGYASRLIAAFRAYARENGACRIELKVVAGNDPAVKLYQKLSFSTARYHMKSEG